MFKWFGHPLHLFNVLPEMFKRFACPFKQMWLWKAIVFNFLTMPFAIS